MVEGLINSLGIFNDRLIDLHIYICIFIYIYIDRLW